MQKGLLVPVQEVPWCVGASDVAGALTESNARAANYSMYLKNASLSELRNENTNDYTPSVALICTLSLPSICSVLFVKFLGKELGVGFSSTIRCCCYINIDCFLRHATNVCMSENELKKN